MFTTKIDFMLVQQEVTTLRRIVKFGNQFLHVTINQKELAV